MNALDGSGPIRFTYSLGVDREPTWSPDGTKIAFTSFRNGGHEVFVMNASGKKQENRTNNSLVLDYAPSWQPLVN